MNGTYMFKSCTRNFPVAIVINGRGPVKNTLFWDLKKTTSIKSNFLLSCLWSNDQ